MDRSIKLYTQPNCQYCDTMKEMLDMTGYIYYTLDINLLPEAKQFLKENDHKTVPQLYVGDTHINKLDTKDYTYDMLNKGISDAFYYEWPEGNGEQEF